MDDSKPLDRSSLYYKCGRKKPFASRYKAQEAATQTYRIAGERLYPYQCEFCGKWHVTKEKI